MWHSLSVVTAGPRGTRCSLDWLVVRRGIYINKKMVKKEGEKMGAGLRGGCPCASRVYCKVSCIGTDRGGCLGGVTVNSKQQ